MQLHQSTFSRALHNGSSFSTSFPILVIFSLRDSSHPNGCEAVAHCAFDLHFSNSCELFEARVVIPLWLTVDGLMGQETGPEWKQSDSWPLETYVPHMTGPPEE